MGDILPISPNDDVTAKYVITEVDIQTVITEEIYVTPTDVNDEAKNVVDETLEPSQPTIDVPATQTKPRTSSLTKQCTAVNDTCPICGHQATKTESIKCNGCNSLVHYPCTKLPPYMLYTHIKKKTKKYECEECTGTIEGILFTEETDPPVAAAAYNVTTEAARPTQLITDTDERIVRLEDKIDLMSTTLKKFDLVKMAENLATVTKQLTLSQNERNETINKIRAFEKETSKKVEVNDERDGTIDDLRGRLSRMEEEKEQMGRKICELADKYTNIYCKWEADQTRLTVLDKQVSETYGHEQTTSR